MAQDTKQRMIEAAAWSLRTRGLAATSFTNVLEASGAARGAIYHHFPGGKDDLAEQAVNWSGRRVRIEIESIAASSPKAVIRELSLNRDRVHRRVLGHFRKLTQARCR